MGLHQSITHGGAHAVEYLIDETLLVDAQGNGLPDFVGITSVTKGTVGA